jgi:pseudouridine synthase
LVTSGVVTVNGKIAESPGMQISPESDVIEVDGKRIWYKPDEDKVYILLNKLPGYLSASLDSHGEPTIMELLPDTGKRLFPVGRLDKDTEGLIIVTNDGDLTYHLTHPKHHVDKVYLAWVNGTPNESSLDKLRRGIELENGITAPATVERESNSIHSLIEGNNDVTCLRITIHEGKKRQIKRMCADIGHTVLKLKRIQLGPITLGDLRPGKYRYLTQSEVKSLKDLGNNKPNHLPTE